MQFLENRIKRAELHHRDKDDDGQKAPDDSPKIIDCAKRAAPKETTVDLKLPIRIFDELSESVIESTGMLDLASGEIRSVEYDDYDSGLSGLPAEDEHYEFTSGLLTNGAKDVEFRVDVDVTTGNYSVTPNELLELKGRAAKLFTAAPTDAAPTIAPRKPRKVR